VAGNGLRMSAAGEAVPFDIPGSTGSFKIQILNEDRDRGVVTSIVHLPAGGVIPAHYHDAGSEMHFVLEGDLTEAGETLGAGAFLTHAKGVVHGPHESKGGARVLTVQTWQSEGGSFDFNPADAGGAPQDGGTAPAAPQGDGTAPASQDGAQTQEAAAADREEKGYS